MIKRLIICLAVLVLSSLALFPGVTAAKAEEGDSEAVIDIDSGRFLYEKNAYKKRHIASLTKIMTAIIVIENADLNKIVTVPEKCCGIEGSSIYLRAGEKLTVKELLYGLMLRSGNDAAETLAVTTFGSIEKFAGKMNEKAREIGARDTNFINPHGLYDGENYSTAHDMALITAYGMKNDTFREIVGTKNIAVSGGESGEKRYFKNKNKLLFNYDKCTGVKTGYTKQAGRCLASSAEYGGLRLACAVLGCGPMYEVSRENFEKAFSVYKSEKLCDKDTFETIFDLGGKSPARGRVKNSFSYPLKEDEKEHVRTEIIMDENIVLPVKKGEKIGAMEIYLKNQLIFSQNIYTIIDVEKRYDLSDPIDYWNFCEDD